MSTRAREHKGGNKIEREQTAARNLESIDKNSSERIEGEQKGKEGALITWRFDKESLRV